ncbi:hypothetical protein ACJJTC_016051 [Scirpophaga incertulas]
MQTDTLFPHPRPEFQVNKLTLAKESTDTKDTQPITLDMLNIGSSLTDTQEQALFDGEIQSDNNQLAETTRDIIRESAKNNINKNQFVMKRKYDSNKAPTKYFAVGDLVMIPNYHIPATGKSKKLCPKFRGPFRVTAVLENDRYEISSIDGHSKRKYKSTYPADALKKWIIFTHEKDDKGDLITSTEDSDDDCTEIDL